MNRQHGRPTSALRIARLVATTLPAIAASVFTSTWPAVARAQEPDGSAAIRARLEQYVRTWNTHDASALGTFFTEDADVVMGILPAAHGRQQIQDWWHHYFLRQEPERHLTLDLRSVRPIAADLAVVTVGTTTGGRNPDGRELLARRFRGAWVLQRRSGDWLIAAMRGLPEQEDRVVLNRSHQAAEALRPRIRAFVRAYEAAFDSHDPSAVSGFYRSDAEMIIRNSPLIRGREAIQRWWRSYFSQPRPYRAVFIIDTIRTMAADVALINITATGAWSRTLGQRLPIRYARATWVIVRDAGQWRISALWVLPSEGDSIVRNSSRSN